MVEKYDYRSWLKAQKTDSRIKEYDECSFIHGYDGDDTIGYCFDYFERSKETTPKGNLKRIYYRFTILVSQDGAKLLSIGRKPLPFEIANKMAETLCAIRESLNNYKFYPKEAMFWNHKPLTPDYISPLWYHHNDVKKVKVEDVEEYIKSLKSDNSIKKQDAGLTDKNGKQICEGDIIRINNSEETFYIKFNGFECEALSKKWEQYRHRIEDDPQNYEVVGNVYNNPELLTED